jgi:ABC-type glutathione transport system ATPase component
MKLEVENLRVSFGDRVVARVPELVISSGESLGVAGESGSGKSMTAFAILGLAPKLGATIEGSVRLDGTELVGASDERLREIRGRRIGMIFQSPSSAFNPVLRTGYTFGRVLALHGLDSRRARRATAEAALAEVRLRPSVLDRYPHQLSGGELQRVAIALALALRAELLLADEPTSALDVTVQAEIFEIISRVRASENLALIFISHDLAAIAEMTDQVMIMRAGEVVETGATREVVNAPSHAYTRTLFEAVPVLGQARNDAAGH